MIRKVLSYRLAKPASYYCRILIPVRNYPRRSYPLPPQDAVDDVGDAVDETDITSELEQIEDSFEFERHNKQMQEEKQRKWLKNKIIQKKYFKEPLELNLISWTAKEQIRYLHAEYPKDWTIQKLARSFPVSEKGIKRILKSNYIVYSQREIEKHDQRVRKNWQQIKQLLQKGEISQLDDEGQFAKTVTQLIESNKLPLMINAAGMSNVSVSPRRFITEKKKIGLFESLVKDYDQKVEQKTEVAVIDSKELLEDISKFETARVEDVTSSPQSEDAKGHESDHNDVDTNKLSRRQKRLMTTLGGGGLGDPLLESSSIENLGLQGTGKIKATKYEYESNFTYSDSVKQKERREKFKVLSELKIEKSKGWDGERVSDGYIYDRQKGYQYPLGKSDKYLERLKMQDSVKSKGDLYVKGKYVYDEDGEFLYKIP